MLQELTVPRMKKQGSITMRSLLVVVVVVVGGLDSSLGDLHISPDSQYCTQHPTFLFCDFLGAQEVVVFESLAMYGGQTVNTLYIHNAAQMLVVNDICVSLMAFNVANITYSGIPDTCNPNQQFSFKLVDSSVNLVPPYISQLDMLRSVAEKVNIERQIRSFSVVSSDVGHLILSLPVSALKIKIEHSVIDHLEKLHLVSQSELVFYNVTINKMSKASLYLQESSVNMWTGNIKTSLEQAIILGPGASITLKDTDGKVSLAGHQEILSVPPKALTQEEHRALTQQEHKSGVPPALTQQEHRSSSPPILATSCKQPSVPLWAFPTVLATVEAIIIIINCTNWFPSLKGKRLPRGLEEGDQGAMRQIGTQGNYSDSTWNYKTEVPRMNVNRRANAGYNKYA